MKRTVDDTTTAEAILEHFRSFIRVGALWHAPDFLGVDVTMSQAKCLFVASVQPDIRMSTLAERLGVGLPAASGLVDRLVDHGYLERREDPADRRQQLVSATDTGHAVFERLRQFSTARLDELMTGLSSSELRALLTGIAALEREALASVHIEPTAASSTHERTPA